MTISRRSLNKGKAHVQVSHKGLDIWFIFFNREHDIIFNNSHNTMAPFISWSTI